MTIKAEKQNIDSIYSAFWFVIPVYQRPYVWEKDNIDALLEDLWFSFEHDRDGEYFLGSLVLQKTEQSGYSEYAVLDGQQRLTTFLILMAVLRDLTDDKDSKEAFQERLNQKEKRARGIPERERIVFKIRDNVKNFVNDFIITPNGTTKLENEDNKLGLNELAKSENVSISHMANAILAMREFFSLHSKEKIYDFGIYAGLHPVFIYVSTDNENDAFRLFNILNDRGVPLTNADILKSINIGEIQPESDTDRYAEKWEQLEQYFGDEFDRFLSVVRTLFVKDKARLNLRVEFEKNIYGKELLKKGKETIDYLLETKDEYNEIIDLSNNGSLSNQYKNLITFMKMGLPSDDWKVPLLAVYKKFKYADDFNLLAFLEKWEYKFSSDWILQRTPTERINSMNALLKHIESSQTFQEVLANNSLYSVENNDLRDVLNREIYGKQLAKYILLKHEYLIMEHSATLLNIKNVTIEHILPQTPKDESYWTETFTKAQREEWTNRLANLVLITGKKNSKLRNNDFGNKKAKYKEDEQKNASLLPSNRVFVEYEEWNIDSLEKRQQEMLDRLVG